MKYLELLKSKHEECAKKVDGILALQRRIDTAKPYLKSPYPDVVRRTKKEIESREMAMKRLSDQLFEIEMDIHEGIHIPVNPIENTNEPKSEFIFRLNKLSNQMASVDMNSAYALKVFTSNLDKEWKGKA